MFTPGSLIKGERILTFITYHIFKVRFSFLLFSQLPFQVKQFYVSCLHNTKGYPKCKYKKGGLKTCVFFVRTFYIFKHSNIFLYSYLLSNLHYASLFNCNLIQICNFNRMPHFIGVNQCLVTPFYIF